MRKTPTIRPAAAQVITIWTACFDPASSALKILEGVGRVSLLKKLTAIMITIDQKAARIGENPEAIETTRKTTGIPRCPRSFIAFQKEGNSALGSPTRFPLTALASATNIRDK